MILIGKGDEVICFHCNVMLTSWRQGAKPWEKHAISSSTCGFVKLMKGPRYAVEVCEGKPADAAEADPDTPEPMEEDGEITGQLIQLNKSCQTKEADFILFIYLFIFCSCRLFLQGVSGKQNRDGTCALRASLLVPDLLEHWA
jgi:hypothetical protein